MCGNQSVQVRAPTPQPPPTVRQLWEGQWLHPAIGTQEPFEVVLSLQLCSDYGLLVSKRLLLPGHFICIPGRKEEKGTAGLFPFEELHPVAFTSISLANMAVPAEGHWDLSLLVEAVSA